MTNMHPHSYSILTLIGKLLLILLLIFVCIVGIKLMISLLPKEKVIQTTYGTDGSVVIGSEIFHPRTGLTEKCSARFKAVAASADSIRLEMVAISKSCDFTVTPAKSS